MGIYQAVANELLPSFVSTIVSVIALSVGAVVVYNVFKKHYRTPKQQIKFRFRVVYISIVIFLIVLIRIWVNGFSHVFTMLSLIAAGLVVTNKESIMNLVGWLIITWRGVFAEGDKIEINSITGYVAWIGPLHFKVYETRGIDELRVTGKTIKVPNGLVLGQAIKTFSPDNELAGQCLRLTLSITADINDKLMLIKDVISKVIAAYQRENRRCGRNTLLDNNKCLQKWFDFTPSVKVSSSTDIGEKVMICIQFTCYARDIERVEQEFWRQVLPQLAEQIPSKIESKVSCSLE